ncbi:hypothetical protein R9C00_10135 [Flammeovirgaceae bacterium SG7u.111]|nr:hypothetical protein [Flammeovirgaceae bacterium SG7u.132]WPO37811.1 hypothetical protein R9C00_10135 [Flammeovirgaceae bacterium SG7u.111]
MLNRQLSEEECQVLRNCPTQDFESIALIGCILKDDTLVNHARRIIATRNKSNTSLANLAKQLLSPYDEEELIEKISYEFITNTDALNKIDDNIYYTLFSVL